MVNNNEQDAQFEYSGKHLAVDLVFGCVLLGIYAAAWYYFEPFKHAEAFGNNDKMNFEIKRAKDIEQRLADVKGIDEIRDEIQDLIKMIKNSTEYTSKGAKLYRGVLLAGSPGTGKTLLARAIAGE